MYQPRIIQVRSYTLEVAKQEEKKVRRGIMLGSLLPVRVDEPSDSNDPHCHDELFRKLEYRDVIQARHLPYTVDIDQLKAWMGFCEKSHRHCNLAMSDPDQRMKT
jgi:hypothetical protein